MENYSKSFTGQLIFQVPVSNEEARHLCSSWSKQRPRMRIAVLREAKPWRGRKAQWCCSVHTAERLVPALSLRRRGSAERKKTSSLTRFHFRGQPVQCYVLRNRNQRISGEGGWDQEGRGEFPDSCEFGKPLHRRQAQESGSY